MPSSRRSIEPSSRITGPVSRRSTLLASTARCCCAFPDSSSWRNGRERAGQEGNSGPPPSPWVDPGEAPFVGLARRNRPSSILARVAGREPWLILAVRSSGTERAASPATDAMKRPPFPRPRFMRKALMATSKPIHPLVKLALEFAPLALFFIANSRLGIFSATGIFMGATLVALAIYYALTRSLPIMLLVSTVVVLIFGGL